MSDQPTFRPRVMPMPKVGDWVVITLSSPSDQRLCQVRSVDGDAFLCGCEGNATRFERTISSPLAGAKSWCFADPAVEAQRLQEAAWRADTSELPEEIRQLLAWNECKSLADSIYHWIRENHDIDSGERFAISESLAEVVPHLLRWQAQQEQK